MSVMFAFWKAGRDTRSERISWYGCWCDEFYGNLDLLFTIEGTHLSLSLRQTHTLTPKIVLKQCHLTGRRSWFVGIRACKSSRTRKVTFGSIKRSIVYCCSIACKFLSTTFWINHGVYPHVPASLFECASMDFFELMKGLLGPAYLKPSRNHLPGSKLVSLHG